jgi:hypothetical protein
MYYPHDNNNNNHNNNMDINELNVEETETETETETRRNERENMITSYMNFITTSTSSINNIIDIIDRQQTTFNNILNTQNIRTIPNSRLRSSRLNSNRHQQHRTRPMGDGPISTIRNRHRPSELISSIRNRHRQSELIQDNISETIRQRLNASRTEQFINNFTTLLFREIQSSPTHQIPTQTQINATTENLIYKDIIEPLNSSCPISQIDFTEDDTVIQIKTCKHIFNETNLKRWFERNSCCPLCRHDILQDTHIIDDTTGETTQDTTGETTQDTTGETTSELFAEPQLDTTSQPILPVAQQLAGLISEQLMNSEDFSGNITVDLFIPRN